MIRKVLVGLAAFLVMAAPLYAGGADSADLVLRKALVKIEEGIVKLNRGLSEAASDLSGPQVAVQDIRRVLRRLVRLDSAIIDCAFVDTEGIMAVIEPGEYRKFEGSDISNQPQVIEVRRGNPVASDIFRSVEGINAIDLQHPVVSQEGEFIGSVSILFKPEAFLDRIIRPLEDVPWLRIWMMQPDGLILYDPDPQQITRNIFVANSFRNFPGLVAFAKRVAYKPTGQGSYDFRARALIDNRVARKDALWGTVAVNNKEWRVVVAILAEPKP